MNKTFLITALIIAMLGGLFGLGLYIWEGPVSVDAPNDGSLMYHHAFSVTALYATLVIVFIFLFVGAVWELINRIKNKSKTLVSPLTILLVLIGIMCWWYLEINFPIYE